MGVIPIVAVVNNADFGAEIAEFIVTDSAKIWAAARCTAYPGLLILAPLSMILL
jgi:hypothetical protein